MFGASGDVVADALTAVVIALTAGLTLGAAVRLTR